MVSLFAHELKADHEFDSRKLSVRRPSRRQGVRFRTPLILVLVCLSLLAANASVGGRPVAAKVPRAPRRNSHHCWWQMLPLRRSLVQPKTDITLLAPNDSVARKSCSCQVPLVQEQRIPRHCSPELHPQRAVRHVVLSGGTTMLPASSRQERPHSRASSFYKCQGSVLTLEISQSLVRIAAPSPVIQHVPFQLFLSLRL